MSDEIINRVAKSGLINIDLEDYVPKNISSIDIKDQLWQGLALKEKDFRAFIKTTDWSQYQNMHVAISCSADATIPQWSFMLLASAVLSYAQSVHFGSVQEMKQALVIEEIRKINTSEFVDARVIIKGCGNEGLNASVYLAITTQLQPVVKSLMYGEPCSTVPIYKK